ncbi:hypothetical protein A1O3_06410 [Capronia epimyces CBS 606.96]|uniref:Xylanolytic transcriptional activator regulatory domain-containing protein n=1 Tax=Capronia epimyces CBS 606.96 TaxID=1182542 RepID=W9XPW9_9EURO|nr:uncharacterized protein A1O3_06410 [Capronia epimyces CBS 606.96]EXJ82597.1 hypothetical protein A1O3_06410 [Capronia epimyces CBS 606.96]
MSSPMHHDEGSSENEDGAFGRQGPQTHSGHIIGPVAARDVQVLEQYMSPAATLPVSHARPNPYSVYSSDARNPIVYLKVPRQRVRASRGNGSAGFRQYEAIEKGLEPLGGDVVDLYFQAFHPPFPILDEKTVLESYRKKALPHVLVCEIYAVSIISWSTSAKLVKSRPHRPDVRYIWTQTVEALNEEFLAPGFSTVLSCILDLTGRPTTSMTYNAINIGRAVALSQSLGLNRDPRGWDLDQRQKALRIRTWWGVLIHDWWASLAHGTPPHIHPGHFDVAVPDLSSLLIGGVTHDNDAGRTSGPRIMGAQSFRALCQLTEILGDILPHVYDTKSRKPDAQLRSLKRIEASVDDWEENLPPSLNPKTPDFQRDLPGALSLHLSFLAVKMCTCRVSLLESVKSDDYNNPETWQYLHLQCRRAAKAVIDFTLSLRGRDLHAFWMPYTAYHFASAAILILRCGLEATSDEVARDCVSAARALVEHLRRAKDEAKWDLADICLSQCESVVHQLNDEAYLRHGRRRNREAGAGAGAGAPILGSQHQEFDKPRSDRDRGVSKTTDPPQRNQQPSASMTSGPGPSSESVLAIDTALPPLEGSNAATHEADATTEGAWDPFAHLTIPDLWEASGLNDYGGSTT